MVMTSRELINREDIVRTIAEIMKETLKEKIGEMDLEEIYNSDNLLELLGINSIIAIQIIAKIESKFGIEFEDEKLTPEIMREFSGFVDYVGKLIEEQK